jgi:hypothetical protein
MLEASLNYRDSSKHLEKGVVETVVEMEVVGTVVGKEAVGTVVEIAAEKVVELDMQEVLPL